MMKKSGRRPFYGFHLTCPTFHDEDIPIKPRRDLSRRAGEKDSDYRRRIVEVIGAMDNFARDRVLELFGGCLEDFASSVSHAEMIGWGGGAGNPRVYHRDGCTCPTVIQRRITSQREIIVEAERAIRDATTKMALAREELVRLEDILVGVSHAP